MQGNDFISIGDLVDNKHTGRGIQINSYGFIHFAYWDDCSRAPGNYIDIFRSGRFDVGEIYKKHGEMYIRGTQFKADGQT